MAPTKRTSLTRKEKKVVILDKLQLLKQGTSQRSAVEQLDIIAFGCFAQYSWQFRGWIGAPPVLSAAHISHFGGWYNRILLYLSLIIWNVEWILLLLLLLLHFPAAAGAESEDVRPVRGRPDAPGPPGRAGAAVPLRQTGRRSGHAPPLRRPVLPGIAPRPPQPPPRSGTTPSRRQKKKGKPGKKKKLKNLTYKNLFYL